jgi:uridine kinase
MRKPIMIAIAGGSGSGKTTIARKIKDQCNGFSTLLFQLDHYYRDLSHLSPLERDKVNFDHPDALEMSLIEDHIKRLSSGLPIERPTYDFASHTRCLETVPLQSADVVIIDGIFSLYSSQVRKYLDCSIFVDVSDDVRFIRRLRRDVDERGRSNDGVIAQYLSSVKPMHEQFVAPTKYLADFVVHWDHYNDRTIGMLKNMILSKTS